MLGINTAVHDVTKRTPTELLFGRKVRNPSQGILNNISDEVSENSREHEKTIEEIRSEARDRISVNQDKNKQRFDRSRKPPTEYKEGDLVKIIRAVAGGLGKSKKLEPKCRGPYRIKKVLTNDKCCVNR